MNINLDEWKTKRRAAYNASGRNNTLLERKLKRLTIKHKAKTLKDLTT